ncbi:fatty acid-binding protein muscle, partial [Biomphalaria pfeifferi]
MGAMIARALVCVLLLLSISLTTLTLPSNTSSRPRATHSAKEQKSRASNSNSMALDHFIGRWLEEKKESFACLADALGLSGEQRAFFENSKSELSYQRNGDTWTIAVGIVGVPQNTTFTFKLGETYDSTNIDGSPLKSVIRQDGNRLVERHENQGQRNFVMDIVREVHNDLMNATTTIG